MDSTIESFISQQLLAATIGLSRNEEELDFLLQFFETSEFQIPRSLDGYGPARSS